MSEPLLLVLVLVLVLRLLLLLLHCLSMHDDILASHDRTRMDTYGVSVSFAKKVMFQRISTSHFSENIARINNMFTVE